MQGVAELVEQGLGVVQRDEERLALRGLDEVVVVGADDVRLLAVQVGVAPVGGRPGARPLARAGEVVGIEDADVAAGLAVGDLEGLHVRMEDRNGPRRQLGELEAIEAVGHVEGAALHRGQLEVGLQVVLIEVVAGFADLLEVVQVIPRLDVVAGQGAHLGDLLADARDGRGPDAHHQVHGGLGGPGHGVLHAPVGMGLEAQEAGALGAQAQDLGDGRLGVVGVAVVAALDELAPDLLALGAVVGEGQVRVDGRTGVGDDPAVQLARPGGVGGRGGVGFRQALDLALGGEVGEELFVGDDLLLEAGEGGRQGLVDAAELFLAGGVERGAVADQGLVAALDHAGLLGAQPGRRGALMDGADALEEDLVEGDLVRGRRQDRRHLAVQGLPVGRADVAGHDAEDRAGAAEVLAGLLERQDGVGEGGGRRIRHDRGDLGAADVDRLVQSVTHQIDRHLVPRRHALIGTRPGVGQDVAGEDHIGGLGRSGSAQAGRGHGEHARAGDDHLTPVHGSPIRFGRWNA